MLRHIYFREEQIMKTIAAVIIVIALCGGQVWAGNHGNALEVRIVSDNGHTLPTYPVTKGHSIRKVYAEAVKGDHYRIEVKNRLNRRVGVVIAVDGRNIISGEKSWLVSSEQKYILDPYGSGTFSGWRTASNRINRFYFTDVPDSYAGAFGDESAMGVISVAAFTEAQVSRILPYVSRSQPQTPTPMTPTSPMFGANDANESMKSAVKSPLHIREQAKRQAKATRPQNESILSAAVPIIPSESAGTGYGREEYSPVIKVSFNSENSAVETVHFKYEWRNTLCKLGVVSCTTQPHHPPNRLWDSEGFAPPPPGRS
jgi:hypothetical protein